MPGGGWTNWWMAYNNDYSSEERQRILRPRRGLRKGDGIRSSRRLFWIDLLLLAVMAGILVPWAIERKSKVNLGPVSAKIKQVSGEFSRLTIAFEWEKKHQAQEQVPLSMEVFDGKTLVGRDSGVLKPAEEENVLLLDLREQDVTHVWVYAGEFSQEIELTLNDP